MLRFYAAAVNSTQGVESQFSELERQDAKRVAQQSVWRLRSLASIILGIALPANESASFQTRSNVN